MADVLKLALKLMIGMTGIAAGGTLIKYAAQDAWRIKEKLGNQ
jgi:hypothetical protein